MQLFHWFIEENYANERDSCNKREGEGRGDTMFCSYTYMMFYVEAICLNSDWSQLLQPAVY